MTSSCQNRPQEKWTPWSRSQLLCWRWEEDVGGQAASYRLVEHVIVLQGVSVKNEWPPYRIPAPLSSIVRYSNTPPLCRVKVMCEHTHHSRKSCRSLLLPLFAFDVTVLSCTFSLLKCLIISLAFLLLCQWNATFLSSNKCCLTPIEQSKCESQWMEQPQ